MNKTQILSEIDKTQEQLNKLQEQLKQVELQERFSSEFYTPIDSPSGYAYCLKLLKTKEVAHLVASFTWDKTPQGRNYWKDIAEGVTHLAEYDIDQIKNWVINYLIMSEGQND